MIYMAFSFVIIILILIASGALHIIRLKKIHKRIEELKCCQISIDDFYKEITVAQGSNFIALAMASWLMLFVAIGYFYFLIPSEMPFSYLMQMSYWASSPVGFMLFGIGVALFLIIIIFFMDRLSESHRNIKLIELYSFYSLSKNRKKLIAMTILLLWISIYISADLVTIYPETNDLYQGISFAFLIISECILVLPIWEERR